MPWLQGGEQPELPFQRQATSLQAAQQAEHTADGARLAVLDAVRSSHTGATCDEIEATLGMRHQTASARLRELALRGSVQDSSQRRPTRSGRAAIVWVALG